MKSRWVTLFLLFTTSLAENYTKPEYEWTGDNPYWPEEIKPCADKWMPLCYQYIEDTIFVPILCICGQDRNDNEFLNNFAQCVGKEAPDNIEGGFMGLQYECSEERLSVNMTKNEFTRLAETGEVDPNASSSISTGAIAGIAVGAIVGGGAVIGLFVWLWLQRRKKNGDRLESNPPSSPKPENASKWGTDFKPEWTANSPVELPPRNHAVAEMPSASAPIYEMDAIPLAPVEMPTPISDDAKMDEKKR
jgi:hypothetical protein